jgi:hypothetical protein
MDRAVLKANRPRKHRRSFGASLRAAPVPKRHANRRGPVGETPALGIRSRRLLTSSAFSNSTGSNFAGQTAPTASFPRSYHPEPQKLANLIPTPQLQPIGKAAASCLHAIDPPQAPKLFLTDRALARSCPIRPRSTEQASQHTSATGVIFTFGSRNVGNKRLRGAGRGHA